MNLDKRLFPFFQPIVGIASGKVIGHEVLARQYDANKEIISAAPVFSSTNTNISQIIEWDRGVRWQALEKYSQSDNTGYLTLNISPSWVEYISNLNALPTLQMIEKLNIDRKQIIIEITETEGDLDKLAKVVQIYRKNGLKVAIDDFGAGFSQLERVMAIRPDIIKIDMALFKQASKGGIASDVVQLLTRLSKRTGCHIVCEGIETYDEFIFGLSCGAQFLQGHLFSQAKAEFQAELQYEKHIHSLRTKFLSRTIAKQEKVITKINDIKELIIHLKQRLQDDFNLNELASLNFEESGILRFYLCNNQGIQTSSNFNFLNNEWFTDATKIGFNWCWRSYFYHLLALEKTIDEEEQRIVSSERYKDFDTDHTCKTLSIRLDKDRILLVDIKTEWD